MKQLAKSSKMKLCDKCSRHKSAPKVCPLFVNRAYSNLTIKEFKSLVDKHFVRDDLKNLILRSMSLNDKKETT